MPPSSLHAWRQADCASQSLNYYQHGMKFLHPELHCMIADGGTSGCSVEEFPIVYYSVAGLYKIFGFHNFWYRLFTFVFFALGLYAFYRMFLLLWNNQLAAMSASLLLFSSTVVAFYSIGFLSNIPAIAITMIAWLLFFYYYANPNKISLLLIALFLFAFATLLKISEGLSFCSVGCIWGLETLNITRFGKNSKKMMPMWAGVAYVFAFLLIFGWYHWAHNYNNLHQQSYYFFAILPMWKLTGQNISDTWHIVANQWFKDYHSPSVLVLLAICWIYIFVFWKSCDKLLRTLSAFLLIGSVAYTVLFYDHYSIHDYYILSLYIPMWFALLTVGQSLYAVKNKNLMTTWSILLAILLLTSVWSTRDRLHNRFFDWNYNFPETNMYKAFYTVEPYLDKIGIKKDDRVISIPDYSTCYSLYLMNRPGWTGYDPIRSSSDIEAKIKKGAKYLIVNYDEFLHKDYLMPFLTKPIGVYQNIHIYKLTE
jgi:hypothetical protein